MAGFLAQRLLGAPPRAEDLAVQENPPGETHGTNGDRSFLQFHREDTTDKWVTHAKCYWCGLDVILDVRRVRDRCPGCGSSKDWVADGDGTRRWR